MLPGQVIFARTRQLQANATSLVAIIPISAVGVAVYYFSGERHQADLGVAALMTAGAVVGAYFGARAATRMPERTLKVLVALVLFAAGLKLLIAPGG
jgi:uncharacterized protein